MSVTPPHLTRMSLAQRRSLEQRLLKSRSSLSRNGPQVELGPKPLSFAQESLWFFDRLVPNSPLYNIPQAFVLRGKLDVSALRKSFETLVQRHEALRTKFSLVDGAPRQMAQTRPFQWELTDLTGLAGEDQERQLKQAVEEAARQPFNLSEDLLLRMRLICLGPDTHALVVTLHHIIADFGSLEILNWELGELYNSALLGRPCQLPPLELQFPDWAARQRNGVDTSSKHAAYWLERLVGPLPILEMPTDYPRGTQRSFQGGCEPIHLPAGLVSRLKSLAAREGVTLFMLLLVGFQNFLRRYSGQEDIVVGVPMGQRSSPETQRLIGCFINTLALRADLSGQPSFRELLKRTRSGLVGAFAHQEMPFEKLVERLQLTREPGVNPLCQVMFQYLASPWPMPHLEGVQVEALPCHTGTAKFELTLTLMDSSDGLRGELEYNTALFNPESAARWVANFQVLLDGIARNPDERITQLPMLTNAERQRLLVEWNQTASDYPRHASVQALFEEQARTSPAAVAIRTGEHALTYRELDQRSNQVARRLAALGVRPRTGVGLCLERSVEMIVAVLGILKSGAFYVPVDLNAPGERVRSCLADAAVSVVISTSKLVANYQITGRTFLLDRDRAAWDAESTEAVSHNTAAQDPAYLMYTSGSTGTPKGVVVPHRAIVRLVRNTNYATFGSEEVFLQFAPLSFDASTFEIWGALLNGAKLVLYPPSFESLEQFARVLRDNQITTLWLTAGLFHEMVDAQLDALRGLRQLLAGGDVLSVPHVNRVLRELPTCQLINGYGPTENTTFTCCHRLAGELVSSGSVPIGRPIANTRVYILDAALAPVPIGVVGELCAAGDGLAQRYWNSPELTSERFVGDPFAGEPGARLYRTGDLARYGCDGTIEFIGRRDDQVKLNGFRIHLGEVESALRRLPRVSQALATIYEKSAGNRQLVAYVVATGNPAAQLTAEWRQALSDQLPSYMVPFHISVLPAFPMTANGKVDRRSLPPPETSTLAPDEGAKQPDVLTPAEQTIIGVWKEVLGRETISIHDNFFQLGGHSLLATRVVSRLNYAFHCNLSVASLFEAPTVRGLAEKLASAPRDSGPGPILRRTRTVLRE